MRTQCVAHGGFVCLDGRLQGASVLLTASEADIELALLATVEWAKNGVTQVAHNIFLISGSVQWRDCPLISISKGVLCGVSRVVARGRKLCAKSDDTIKVCGSCWNLLVSHDCGRQRTSVQASHAVQRITKLYAFMLSSWLLRQAQVAATQVQIEGSQHVIA